ncbi:multidrug transporter EmrE-like cation transporter [Geomicrobium halophilum]|uniref:Multidrug transporter EmrE-like cation transporter n=1 Tax=Geomicrobium halophilum TaxID=549000 RepID=A0A841PTQ1_9BACL|nr:multidrug efflux SMR transporter [Geomicrobium halophilum]MBB6451154.1 multidrug transporter EmrE-like cation transporter [Geomicrobium halophilum]
MIYLVLFFAIIIASVGDAALKMSNGFQRLWPTATGILVYFFTFYLLSVVMMELPIGITYATWSGLGVILTAFVGVFFFKEKLNGKVLISMGVIVIGVVLLNV